MMRRPSSMCCSSRPRNSTLTSTLSLCSRNLRAWLILVSTSWSPVLGRTRISFSFCWCDLVLSFFLLLLVAELAVVHDLADRRPFRGGHFDQIELGLAGHVHGLRGRNDAELFAVGADEANGTDADLLVDAMLVSVTLGWDCGRWDQGDTLILLCGGGLHPAGRSTRESRSWSCYGANGVAGILGSVGSRLQGAGCGERIDAVALVT